MKDILLSAQIIISVGLVILILLQAEGAGIGSTFGGSSGFYRSKRGVEKLLVNLTIIFAVLFFLISVIQLAI
ncbi:MAG: preprotein translocase subunit SecG [Candidatus Portnoybacteria bacterium CG10_big_fil_rev_8_21_14_0_10_36_7]|uniref:Protein-export membrane protein SecG n=1 Tax=Candidatus Portnoybacteria bacterium CG10_big_fil_rev_8_21_14_0_10_36_7 TaxID=1974812 RepID=A0A2M8KEL1_9BACT|nr:MAG: preprotein translocase subunit SecG [Candidatus Portnoybacteria bacterium CG10_big_fil_rev_8_21_14_0_10_36_7]